MLWPFRTLNVYTNAREGRTTLALTTYSFDFSVVLLLRCRPPPPPAASGAKDSVEHDERKEAGQNGARNQIPVGELVQTQQHKLKEQHKARLGQQTSRVSNVVCNWNSL